MSQLHWYSNALRAVIRSSAAPRPPDAFHAPAINANGRAMKRLGIDARVLGCQPHHGLGVWRYLTRILERAPQDDWEITLFGDVPESSLPQYAFSGRFRYEHVTSALARESDGRWEQ